MSVENSSSHIGDSGISVLRLRLAMKIGGEYFVRMIGRRHWERLARDVGRDAEEVVANARAAAQSLPALVAETRARVEAEGIHHPILDRLAEKLTDRSAKCLGTLR